MKETLIPIFHVYGAFVLIYLTNLVLGLTQNVFIKKEAFEVKKLTQSVGKLIINLVGVIAVALAFTLLNKSGIIENETTVATVSIGTFLLLYAKAFYQYSADVYDKMKDCFEITADAQAKTDTYYIQDPDITATDETEV